MSKEKSRKIMGNLNQEMNNPIIIKPIHIIIGLFVLTAVILFVVLEFNRTPTNTNNSPNENTLEYKLASINIGRLAEKTDIEIYQFKRLLDSIKRKCRNGLQEIADVTIKTKELLKEKGVDLTLMDTMEKLNQSIPEEAVSAGLDIKEIAAAFVVLTRRK